MEFPPSPPNSRISTPRFPMPKYGLYAPCVCVCVRVAKIKRTLSNNQSETSLTNQHKYILTIQHLFLEHVTNVGATCELD